MWDYIYVLTVLMGGIIGAVLVNTNRIYWYVGLLDVVRSLLVLRYKLDLQIHTYVAETNRGKPEKLS